jgi:DHA2 family methylenomycin A resistance protein-like MFS transporter
MQRVKTRCLADRYPERAHVGHGKGRLLLTMCLAVLLAQVDTSVVNLATRSIGVDLGVSVTGLQWVLDAYNLAYALLLLTGGLLADLYGRRRLFLLGVAVFTGGSVLCAAAPDGLALIAGRAIAGIGAALLLPASLSIIRVEWSEQRARNRVLGIWAACNGLAFAIGPTVGGALVDASGWRSVFLIAVPLGLATIGFALRVIPESRDPGDRRFDALGQIWGAATLGGLALAGIDAARDRAVAGVALAAATIALPSFLFTERRRGPAAMLPLDLFISRRLIGALSATSAMTFGMYGLLFLVPLIWQTGGTVPASTAGLALMPMACTFFVLSNISGRLAERLGARVMISGGTALIGAGLLVIACTAAGRPLWLAETGLVLAGLGMGLNTGPLFGVAVQAVPASRSGSASSLINVARMIGATLGVAVLGTAFAIAGSGAPGLRAAMLLGGAVQIGGAYTAWAALRSSG